MGMSKKDLHRRKANLRSKIDELEKKAKMDPMKRDKSLHAELDLLKKKLAKEN